MKFKDIFSQKIYKYLMRFFIIAFNILLLVSVTAIFADSVMELYFSKSNAQTRIITIKKDQSFKDIARELEKAKVISSWQSFTNWMVRYGWDRKIRSGRFRLPENNSLFDVMNRICRGGEYLEAVTISEGLRMDQVALKFANAGVNKNKFLSLCFDSAFLAKLAVQAPSLEGFLFPDTYRISYAEDPEKVIKMMVKRFFNVIDDLNYKQSAIYQRSGIKNCMTLASLVEKETSYDPERKMIASVFWNRLKNNWRLDSDVTVRYALKKWQGKLTRKDLKYDSEYNTRKYKGVPPGPICNPGRKSLEAAFFPEESSYMFFVASGSEKGDSIFSVTLKEHSRAVKKLRKQGLI